MLDQASIRSTVRIEMTKEQFEDFQAGKSLWSDMVTLAKRTKKGEYEKLCYRIEMCKEMVRLHWQEGSLHWRESSDVDLYWRHRCTCYSYSEEDVCKVCAQPGSVLKHSKAPYYIGRAEYSFEVQLDILVDENQIDVSSESAKKGLVGNLINMRMSEELCDTVLICGDKKFLCHRLVLAGCKVFKAMLFADGDFFKEKKEGTIVIEDFQPTEVEQFVNVLYGSKCDFQQADPWPMLRLADKYDIDTLVKDSIRVLQGIWLRTKPQFNAKYYLGSEGPAERGQLHGVLGAGQLARGQGAGQESASCGPGEGGLRHRRRMGRLGEAVPRVGACVGGETQGGDQEMIDLKIRL